MHSALPACPQPLLVSSLQLVEVWPYSEEEDLQQPDVICCLHGVLCSTGVCSWSASFHFIHGGLHGHSMKHHVGIAAYDDDPCRWSFLNAVRCWLTVLSWMPKTELQNTPLLRWAAVAHLYV